MLSKKLHTLHNGQKVAYYSSVNLKGPTYIFLAPGAFDSSFFLKYIDKYLQDKSWLMPDYPGRGSSDTQNTNTIVAIAYTLNNLLDELELNEVIIIAYSFGTQVGIELVKINQNRYTSIHLVAVGEFFKPLKRFIYKTIFSVPLLLKPLIPWYRKILIKNKIFAESFPISNLDIICKQWLGTLSYNYKFAKPVIVKTYFYIFKDDEIINKTSFDVLKKYFVNNEWITLKGTHPMDIQDYSDFEKEFLINILE